mmetsp:Transcript_37910/g.49092  ORF Transcript_37910/g.49092 Transcript_37910/m.49092 type:complete len:87 (+) Transcript_37910:2349-2609(+)
MKVAVGMIDRKIVQMIVVVVVVVVGFETVFAVDACVAPVARLLEAVFEEDVEVFAGTVFDGRFSVGEEFEEPVFVALVLDEEDDVL